MRGLDIFTPRPISNRASKFQDAMMSTTSRSVLMPVICGHAYDRIYLSVNVTPVIGTHVGPNGLGFASVKAR